VRSWRGFWLSLVALLIASFALGAGLLAWLGGGGSSPKPAVTSATSDQTRPAANPSLPAEPVQAISDSGSAPAPVDLHTITRLVVPGAGIDAPVVTLGVNSDGVMQAPSTPTDVGWYNFSSLPDGGGNIVMSGHVDYVNYGPAIFWNLRDLKADDVVQLVLDNGSIVNYHVTAVTSYDDATAPVQQIIGATPAETITMITCSGTFDPQSREYDERLVVRAVRS
jgi:sortase (surface protein transpeptidase)